MSTPSPESILAQELARLSPGDELDVDAICDRHPKHAKELKSLAPVFAAMMVELRASGVVADTLTLGSESEYSRIPSAQSRRVLESLRGRPKSGPRYKLRGEVARGGMGAIFKVHDTDLDRDLAMKVTLSSVSSEVPSQPEEDQSVGRFLEEARITGRLDHPGVVPVHELGIDEQGRVFFTMRLVRGRDLGAIFRLARAERDDWNLPRALSALQRVCETMAFAHSRGVIHRDLKPANVMVGRFGEVYVMDWGLARLAGSDEDSSTGGGGSAIDPRVTQEGDVLGTPPFMSPEQAAGDLLAVDHRTDVYAAGAMLYELLTGSMPYLDSVDGGGMGVLMRIAQGPPTPVARLANDTPPELEAICERAMSREREERYSDMEAMADDLRAYLEGRVVRAYRTGAWAELKKWVQRNRALALSIASALALLVVGISSVAYTQARGRQLVLRLADGRRVNELRDRVRDLWPIHPDSLPAMREWLTDARRLADERREAHVEDLASLRDGVTPVQRAPSELLEQQQATVDSLVHKAQSEPGDTDLAQAVSEARARLASIRKESKLDYRIEETEDAWWQSQLAPLVDAIGELSGPNGLLPLVSTSLELAESVEDVTLSAAGPAWANAIASIASSKRYGGLVIEPQLGLLPIGVDPQSGLWEFLVYGTGLVPERSEDGHLQVTGETGVVLVLAPGGTFWMGADPPSETHPSGSPNVDDNAVGESSPVHQVTLDPFFIGKHEVTQGQWLRIAGENPSDYDPDFLGPDEPEPLRYPVEKVTWNDCMLWLPRFQLTVPTEAQWEYAARAGTRTSHWCGADPDVLARSGNVADQYLKENEGDASWQYSPWNDGQDITCPVDMFDANAFGLHLVIGNVEEWCLERYDGGTPGRPIPAYELPVKPGTGERLYTSDDDRITRGGNYQFIHHSAASAFRARRSPDFRNNRNGVRPVRLIQ